MAAGRPTGWGRVGRGTQGRRAAGRGGGEGDGGRLWPRSTGRLGKLKAGRRPDFPSASRSLKGRKPFRRGLSVSRPRVGAPDLFVPRRNPSWPHSEAFQPLALGEFSAEARKKHFGARRVSCPFRLLAGRVQGKTRTKLGCLEPDTRKPIACSVFIFRTLGGNCLPAKHYVSV